MLSSIKPILKTAVGQQNIDRSRAVIRRGQAILYGRGDSVACPVCSRTFSRFLSFGRRSNVWCPNCGSLERHRLLYLCLRDDLNFFEGPKRVLHFAAERCLAEPIRRQKNIDYTTADLLVSLIPGVEVKPDVQMSVTDIQFADDTFDVVLCSHVLEHVRDDALAMNEIQRVLKPNGYAILQVPIDYSSETTAEDPNLGPEDRQRLYGFADHVRYYGLDYALRLRSAGFVVEESRFVDRLDWRRFVLDPRETIHLCRLPPD